MENGETWTKGRKNYIGCRHLQCENAGCLGTIITCGCGDSECFGRAFWTDGCTGCDKYERRDLQKTEAKTEEGQRKMKVYISGAITGTNDFMERFKAAEDRLTSKGMGVINPARVNSCMPKNTTYEEYMGVGLYLLDMCEAIYMLDGWRESCGANREYGYALAKGKKILFES